MPRKKFIERVYKYHRTNYPLKVERERRHNRDRLKTQSFLCRNQGRNQQRSPPCWKTQCFYSRSHDYRSR